MKKLLVLSVVGLSLAACGSENTVDVFGQKCEKIITGERGDFVAKCPVSPELESIRSADKNAMFLSVNADVVSLEEMAADAEHIYVNVVPAGTFEEVEVNCYRVMAAEPVLDGEAMYATEVCIQ